jgi:hypothetical protein
MKKRYDRKLRVLRALRMPPELNEWLNSLPPHNKNFTEKVVSMLEELRHDAIQSRRRPKT